MISDKNISAKSLAIGTLSIVITGLALACISTSQLNTADRVQAQEQEQSTAAIRVTAGGGNATAPWTIFMPQRVEIKAGYDPFSLQFCCCSVATVLCLYYK